MISGTPVFFRMCGKQRTLSPLFLYVWQLKDLQARFSYVRQIKELSEKMTERLGGTAAGVVWVGAEGAKRSQKIVASFVPKVKTIISTGTREGSFVLEREQGTSGEYCASGAGEGRSACNPPRRANFCRAS